MSAQVNFSLPGNQVAVLQIPLTPPTSISGWTVQFDLLYRQSSQSPIISKYLASGYTSGQSGCSLVDGAKGIFNIQLYPSDYSGAGLSTNVLTYRTQRVDSGVGAPLNGGFITLPPY